MKEEMGAVGVGMSFSERKPHASMRTYCFGKLVDSIMSFSSVNLCSNAYLLIKNTVVCFQQ